MGVAGACACGGIAFWQLPFEDVVDYRDTLLVNLKNTKNHTARSFVIKNSSDTGIGVVESTIDATASLLPDLGANVDHGGWKSGTVAESRKKQEINYDSPRGGVSVITEKGDVTISSLLIQRATEKDSGKYTCHPTNANPKSLTIHVLNEYPAAMQHGGQLRLEYPLSVFCLSLFLCLFGR